MERSERAVGRMPERKERLEQPACPAPCLVDPARLPTLEGRRGCGAGFWRGGCSAAAFPFFLNPISNPVQGIGGGRLSMLYHVGSTETRELLAAPCGTIIHELLGALSPGNESPRAPGRLCPRPRRTEAARRVPWMRAGQTDTPGKSRWLQQASTRPS